MPVNFVWESGLFEAKVSDTFGVPPTAASGTSAQLWGRPRSDSCGVPV